MARYIDADLLISELKHLNEQTRLEYMGVYDCIKSAPTADVIEVIRCKDCALRKTEDCAMYYECDYCGCQHTWEIDNDYCSWAKRKEDEE